jgi:hypothetical protein
MHNEINIYNFQLMVQPENDAIKTFQTNKKLLQKFQNCEQISNFNTKSNNKNIGQHITSNKYYKSLNWKPIETIDTMKL